MLTLKELRTKDMKALQQELKNARTVAVKTQIPVRMGQDKKSCEAKKKQHYVAQILTVMNHHRKSAPTNDQSVTPAEATPQKK